MERAYIEEKHFKKLHFSETTLEAGDYENCTFMECNFSKVDLSKFNFQDCVFKTCDLSLVKLGDTGLKNVKFENCKLLGLHFDDCNDFLFEVNFTGCTLNLSSFYKRKMKKAVFRNCQLHEIDFTEVDFTGAIFDNCDLSGSIFMNSILEKADFTASHNYTIDPESNKIKKAKFSLAGLPGLLQKYDVVID